MKARETCRGRKREGGAERKIRGGGGTKTEERRSRLGTEGNTGRERKKEGERKS